MFKLALKFVRPKILTTCYLIVFLGSLSVSSVTIKSFLAIFVLAAWYIHAASSNDYADREIDAINLKDSKNRPLVTRSLSSRRLWTIHTIAGILALLFSACFGYWAIALTIVVLALDYAYSFKPIRLTDRGALSQLVLPIAYVVYPFCLGYLSTSSNQSLPWLLVAGLYAGFIARLFLKDFRDVKGDSKFGKRTFLIRHGRKLTCLTSEAFAFVSFVLISFSVNFSLGTLLALVIGHVFALRLLLNLIKTENIKEQMTLIAALAKVGNSSVLAILGYFAVKRYLNLDSLGLLLLPLSVGLVTLTLSWRSYISDLKAQLT